MFVQIYVFFFFFKQKTAYEMRISDWSSDVCSSDLTVWSNVSHPNDFISDIMNNMFSSHGKRFDAWTDVQWTAPGSMSLLSYYAEPGTPKEDGNMHTSIHVMTPESPDTTHYFWAFGRDIDRKSVV